MPETIRLFAGGSREHYNHRHGFTPSAYSLKGITFCEERAGTSVFGGFIPYDDYDWFICPRLSEGHLLRRLLQRKARALHTKLRRGAALHLMSITLLLSLGFSLPPNDAMISSPDIWRIYIGQSYSKRLVAQ